MGRVFKIAVGALALVVAGGCAAVLGLDAGELAITTTSVDGEAPKDAGSDDAATVDGGPRCTINQRGCGTTCVNFDDWSHGCAGPSCDPCSLPFALTSTCMAGTCAVGTCRPGRADCKGGADDGCETDLNLATSCGSCTTVCDAAAPFCDNPRCVSGCDGGKSPCGTSCVDTTSDPNHCGGCEVKCAKTHAQAACAGGQCGALSCDSPWGNCNQNDGDGCETPINTDENCGGCGNDCRANNPAHTTRSCPAGNACSALSCVSGWNDCDGNLNNGCECSGVGCCKSTDSGGADASCGAPGSACDLNSFVNTCCGWCVYGAVILPLEPPTADGHCCTTSGGSCNGNWECCNGGCTGLKCN